MNYPLQHGGFNQPQQNWNLPYAKDRLMYQPIGVDYGQPPFIPQVNCPQQLYTYMALITSAAMMAIQNDPTQNPLRIFLYNQMAANSYQNPDFSAFMDALIRLIDMTANVAVRNGQNPDIPRIIQECTQRYAQYKTASNVNNFPGLLQGMPQEAAQAAQGVCQQFLQSAQQMEMVLNQTQQQTGWGAPQPQQQWGQPIGGGGGYGGNVQRSQQNWSTGAAVAPVGLQPSGVFTNPNNPSGWGNAPGIPDRHAPIHIPVNTVAVTAPKTTLVHKASPILGESLARSAARVVPTPAPPPMEAPQAYQEASVSKDKRVLCAHEVGVLWKSSVKYPFTFAYDPNTTELQYVVDDTGEMQPILTKKDLPMDRSKHLTAPSITPKWATQIPVLAPDPLARIPEDPLKLEDFEIIEPPPINAISQSRTAHWAKNEATIAQRVVVGKRRIMLLKVDGIVVSTVPADEEIELAVLAIQDSSDPAAAAEIIQASTDTALRFKDEKNLRALEKINTRLTERVNRYIQKELALSSGTITDYKEDGAALSQYLNDKYGSSVSAAYDKAHTRIVNEALTMAEGPVKDAVIATYYNNIPMEDVPPNELVLLHFCEDELYVSTDISSTELRLELGDSTVAVGLTEEALPLFYSIAANAMATAAKTGSKRILVRSSDEVTYEITRGAMNPKYFLVSLLS